MWWEESLAYPTSPTSAGCRIPQTLRHGLQKSWRPGLLWTSPLDGVWDTIVGVWKRAETGSNVARSRVFWVACNGYKTSRAGVPVKNVCELAIEKCCNSWQRGPMVWQSMVVLYVHFNCRSPLLMLDLVTPLTEQLAMAHIWERSVHIIYHEIKWVGIYTLMLC